MFAAELVDEDSQMSTPYVRCLVLWAWAWALCGSVHAEEAPDRQAVVVSGPTRLDWTYALANQSVVDPPAEWLVHARR